MNDTFDFVIVGAGSAGCVIARRLSNNPRNRILLVEAGPEARSPFIKMPLGFGRTLGDPRHTWHYPAEPEESTGGQSRIWLRGKVLGGSSAVNGMVYTRGHPQDYDDWLAQGATGWGWSTLLEAFKAIEDHELGADEWRGTGGPLHVSIQKHRTPVTEAMLMGCAALGTPVKPDINRPDQEGVGYSPLTIRNGRRVSSYEAFLKPVRRRRNLMILTGALVERVVIEGGRATGIVVRQGDRRRTISATREVILCAGTIGSPKLLMLSGIGPAAHLKGLGISVACDRPSVGTNLSEHKAVWIEHEVLGQYGHNPQLNGWRLAANALRYMMLRTGPMATSVDINGFIRTEPSIDRPDAQICIWSLTALKGATKLTAEPFAAISAGGWQLRPKSRGTISLRSSDPADWPVIRPNFLTHDHDRQVLTGTFRYLRALFRQPEVAALIGRETIPGDKIESDAEILRHSYGGENGYHATGTCRMGSDAAAVVDPQLRVKGVSGLRVIDCSVMPTQVSSGVNGPVMALAWHAASMIPG